MGSRLWYLALGKIGILLNTCLMYSFYMQQTFFYCLKLDAMLCAMSDLRMVS